MLKRLVSHSRTTSKKNRISPGQQRLPWDWDEQAALNHKRALAYDAFKRGSIKSADACLEGLWTKFNIDKDFMG
ncbi:hypothetical protein EV13_1641 [Prochlorococcus sp. MIT 0702]|nr:hypothetical protein EV13_1641 [Prochlorococcus sp. MIT 0702]KGG28705.1 hypothetical protein EV12_0600 [Prochlorococcus sp. MIT 0701]KGG36349.1 hypothetical protein EV14_0443 [Prochlorococcus sp. MIT 0703]